MRCNQLAPAGALEGCTAGLQAAVKVWGQCWHSNKSSAPWGVEEPGAPDLCDSQRSLLPTLHHGGDAMQQIDWVARILDHLSQAPVAVCMHERR